MQALINEVTTEAHTALADWPAQLDSDVSSYSVQYQSHPGALIWSITVWAASAHDAMQAVRTWRDEAIIICAVIEYSTLR
jgi:hypothetical protein